MDPIDISKLIQHFFKCDNIIYSTLGHNVVEYGQVFVFSFNHSLGLEILLFLSSPSAAIGKIICNILEYILIQAKEVSRFSSEPKNFEIVQNKAPKNCPYKIAFTPIAL